MQESEKELSSNIERQLIQEKKEEKNDYKFLASAYIVGVTGVTAVVAGLVTAHVAKKESAKYFKETGKELKDLKVVMESPHSLALRALAWGTFWAVGFCSLSAYGVWKWFGIKDLDDLRTRLRKYTRRSNETDEKLEFDNAKELLNYLIDPSSYKKKTKDT